MLGWNRRKLKAVEGGRTARQPVPEDYRVRFRRQYFADVPVDLEAIGEFRAEFVPQERARLLARRSKRVD